MIRTLSLALVAALMLVSQAVAVQPIGSKAWVLWDSKIYDSADRSHQVIDTIGEFTPVRVDRCRPFWCQIHAKGVSGWISRSKLDFGRGPDSRFPRLHLF